MNEQNKNEDSEVVQPAELEPVKGSKLASIAKYSALTIGGLMFLSLVTPIGALPGSSKTARLKLEERKARLQEAVKQEQLQIEQTDIVNDGK